ncbi:hypothetical protein [Endozoicomonas lisbonensis]|uniref:MotA/TolQ/ExbB proton channel domain-containing protein n=1 Tax=Endozoicomonas lisbonensis TaxID=3120522 RepID=A0ABV2SLX0_9GAMM
MLIPLSALCEHCSHSFSLGEAAERSIIEFWRRHSLIINRDNALDRLLVRIQCRADSASTRSLEGSLLQHSDETTPLLASCQHAVGQRTSRHPLFFRAHHMFSALHQNSYLRSARALRQYQQLMESLREFSYEAVQNLDEDAANDLLALLGQVEPLMGQMAGIAAGRPQPSTLQHLRHLATRVPVYTLVGSAMSTLLTTLVGGFYSMATCQEDDECLNAHIKVGAAGAGIVFFGAAAIIYRCRCDPAIRELRRMRESHSHSV